MVSCGRLADTITTIYEGCDEHSDKMSAPVGRLAPFERAKQAEMPENDAEALTRRDVEHMQCR